MNKGIVIKSTGTRFVIKDEDNQKIECTLKGNFRIRGIKSTNPVAIGDCVEFKIIYDNLSESSQPRGLITNICERKNYIVRRSQNLSKQSHILAANIDQVLLVATLMYPTTTTTFIDRFLATAEAYSIPTTLIFNKIDLLSQQQLDEIEILINTYERIGYPCIKTSSVTQQGLVDLKKAMINKVNLLGGHSGVGKSSLLNILQPGLSIKTAEISSLYNTGKHSTTYSEMYELDFGGFLIDTPGIKAFGMLNMETWEISHYFPEIFQLSAECQYNNCTHTHEPGCAIKVGISKGLIAQSRYISYLGLLEGDKKYRGDT